MELNNDLPKWIGSAILVLGFIGGVFRAIFVVQSSVASHSKTIVALNEKIDSEIAKVDGRINKFHGKCEVVEVELSKVMTLEAHAASCSQNTENLCREIKALKEEQRKTNINVDGNRNFVADQLRMITKFMGKIDGRNEMIDKERERRTTDK